MTRKRNTTELVAQFVKCIKEEIHGEESRRHGQIIKRRKLRTVTRECGFRKASVRFLEALREQLAEAGVFTEPSLLDPGLNANDWVRLSLEPIPSSPVVFAKEAHLQQLVLASLGQGVFRNLKPFRSPGNQSGLEYRLPNGKRIDLLCQERTKHRAGTLVAIELKRHNPPETVRQLVGYLDALYKAFKKKREVRGIIVSGPEDPAAPVELKGVHGCNIEWYRYNVEFDQQQLAR